MIRTTYILSRERQLSETGGLEGHMYYGLYGADGETEHAERATEFLDLEVALQFARARGYTHIWSRDGSRVEVEATQVLGPVEERGGEEAEAQAERVRGNPDRWPGSGIPRWPN